MNWKIVLSLLVFYITSVETHIYGQTKSPKAIYQEAKEAEGSLQLQASRTLFETVLSNSGTDKETVCNTLRALAIQDWKFHKNYKAAKVKLQQADSIGEYRSETWLVMLRVEEESKHYKEALKAGKRALTLSISEADKTYAQYKYARVILNQAIDQLNSNVEFDSYKLKEALDLLKTVLKNKPTHANAANALLGIALLLKDGKTAYQAWLSYFRYSSAQNAYPYLKQTATILADILPYWNGGTLSFNEQAQLIEGLAQSRFYNYAKLLAERFQWYDYQNNTTINDIVNYTNYKNSIETVTNEYYRKSASNQADTRAFFAAFDQLNSDLFAQLQPESETYSLNSFRTLIRSKFGTVIMIGQTSSSSVTGLVFGHIVNEHIQNVEQYGHQADFNFTELDMMVSNGYPSWFWENRGAGGFAIPGGYLRVKTMFKYLGIDAWNQVTDPVKRSKTEAKIRTNLLESTKVTDPKIINLALSQKLELDALDTLYNKLVVSGYSGLELQLKFIETYDGYRDNATMFAHEGRHSLDRIVLGDVYGQLGSTQIEYRGRLSQIAFSEAPKLELAGMINSLGTTANGEANTMIANVIENWMGDHTEAIHGFDSSKLLISQMYKLTNEQIQTAIRLVDPFYLDNLKD